VRLATGVSYTAEKWAYCVQVGYVFTTQPWTVRIRGTVRKSHLERAWGRHNLGHSNMGPVILLFIPVNGRFARFTYSDGDSPKAFGVTCKRIKSEYIRENITAKLLYRESS
jgi:hypothetical protein